jgi:hypothetical protein
VRILLPANARHKARAVVTAAVAQVAIATQTAVVATVAVTGKPQHKLEMT